VTLVADPPPVREIDVMRSSSIAESKPVTVPHLNNQTAPPHCSKCGSEWSGALRQLRFQFSLAHPLAFGHYFENALHQCAGPAGRAG